MTYRHTDGKMKTIQWFATRDSGTWEHWEQAVDKISKGKLENEIASLFPQLSKITLLGEQKIISSQKSPF